MRDYKSLRVAVMICATLVNTQTHTQTALTDYTINFNFNCTAPTVWNSLNSYTVDSGSPAVFKSRLKTFLFRRTFNPV